MTFHVGQKVVQVGPWPNPDTAYELQFGRVLHKRPDSPIRETDK